MSDQDGDGTQDAKQVELEKKLKHLRKVRGGHRGFATKLIQSSEDLLKAVASTGDDKNAVITTDLRTNRELLKGKLVELKGFDQSILELIDDETEYGTELIEAGESNRRISRVIVATEEYLEGTKLVTEVKTEVSESRELKVRKFNPIRLPRLDFPTFNGDPLQWKSFWDTFECIVDKDDSIDDMMKFTYLRQKLEGQAKIALDGLTLTKANYREAVKLLKERFGDEQFIIQSHMDELLALEPCESGNVESLRKLYDVVEVHIRNLQQFQIALKNYGPVLISIVVNKLPEEVKLEITRQMPDGKWQIEKLMEAVKKEVTARERCYQRSLSNSKYGESSSSTLITGNGNGNRRGGSRGQKNKVRSRSKKFCIFCERSNHNSENCRTVTGVVERRNIVRNLGKCFVCLGANHMAKECWSKRGCSKCNGKHHVSICQNEEQTDGGTGGQPNDTEDDNDGTANIVNSDGNDSSNDGDDKDSSCDEIVDKEQITNNIVSVHNKQYVLLQTAKTFVYGQDVKKKASARIIFDNCSQRSYINESLRSRLNLQKVGEKHVSIKAFGATKGEVKLVDIVAINVCTREQPGKVVKVRVLVVPLICLPVANQFVDNTKKRYPVLSEIQLADDNKNSTDMEIDILIGANYLCNFVSSESIQVTRFLRAIRTNLGWVLNGTVEGAPDERSSAEISSVLTMHVQEEETTQNFQKQVQRFWEIEDCDVTEEKFDVENFKSLIQFNGERYTVPLPFLPGMMETLPTNYASSLRRLSSITRKLDGNPEMRVRYNEVIRKQEAENKIERVYDIPPQGKVHFLPHHPIEKLDRETTKTRVVFDGSDGNPSLNDCLDKGENLVPLLFDVLIRSRFYRIALISDIKEAFLNVGLNKEFRDFVRFLWYDDVYNPEQRNIIMYRFTRVLFGVNASLWLLVVVIHKHLEKYADKDPEFVKYVLRCLFVDDNVGGADDSTAAFELYAKLKRIFLEAGFDLRKWCSNDSKLVQQIKEAEAARNQDDGTTDVVTKLVMKTLGVTWNVKDDNYEISTKHIFNEGRDIEITKRNVLKIIASVYDPVGIIALVTITFKIFFQQLTQMKISWDRVLSVDLQVEWMKILEMLEDDAIFQIPRYVFQSHKLKDMKNIVIHGFCDASDVAYSAVIYAVGEINGERISCFVASKTKVAPIKKISTPRLELCSCLLLANLMFKVIQALDGVVKVSSKVCWNDSVDALCWIKNPEKRRMVFIENRVRKIRMLMPPEGWRYIPTDVNPADVASRGIRTRRGVQKEFPKWMSGPAVLLQSPDDWPKDLSDGKEAEPEEKVTVNCVPDTEYEVVCLHITCEETSKKIQKVRVQKRPNLEKIIDIERFSCLWKLLRVTTWVLRAVAKFKSFSPKHKSEETLTNKFLSIHEIQESERAWIVTVQQEFDNRSKQLNNTLGIGLNKDGVLTCRGRMENADLTIQQKHPILIPGGSHFARLIIRDAHLRTAHGGPKDTLVELRSRYWVTKARTVVRQVLHRCPRPCKRLEGQAFKSVEASQLPTFRVQRSYPFANTGVDYLGPALVRQVYDHDNVMHKVWIVLYTCAVTRAVHLDLVPDSSASTFLRSLKRFIGRRGVPNLMISDNATCFKNEEVRLNEELLRLRVKWQFIAEASPWWGGFWERLVQTVKRSLRKVLFRASVTYEELQTTIVEVEGIVNSRPLTYAYDNDVEEILTPSHLLLGRRLLSTFEEPFDDGCTVDNVVLTKRMAYLRSLSEHFWKRFRDEYLLELRSHHTQGKDPERLAEVGEIVVIHGTNKRNDWRLGKIISLNAGSDGRIRSGVVRTFDGSKSRYIRRAIERLHPIEVKSVMPVSKEEIAESSNSIDDGIVSSGRSDRPRRVAAGECQKRDVPIE